MNSISSQPRLFSRLQLQYDIELQDDFLGSGAFGEAYRCRILPSGEIAAVKVLNCPRQLRDRVRRDFHREVCILHQLAACPNIIRLLGLCMDAGHYSIVMEFAENGDLEELLLEGANDHPVIKEWECRIGMGLDIAKGMDFLHRQQPPIIHRDLKTSNILVDGNYCCKISDFGLSTARSISTQSTKTVSQRNAAGTVPFIAPEIFKGQDGGKKTDVFAYSIVLWQLKEMKKPYKDTHEDVIRANVVANIRPPLSNDSCPDGLRDLIARCWNSNPDVRLSFGESLRMLRGVLHEDLSGSSIQLNEHPLGARPSVPVKSKVWSTKVGGRRQKEEVSETASQDGWEELTDTPFAGVLMNQVITTEEKKVMVGEIDHLYTTDKWSSYRQWDKVANTHKESAGALQGLFAAQGSTFGIFCYNIAPRIDQSVAKYVGSNNSWKHVMDLPSPLTLNNFAVASDNDHFYLVGGKDDSDQSSSFVPLNTVLQYDIRTCQLVKRAEMARYRSLPSCIVVGKRLFIGGGDRGDDLNIVDAISLDDFGCLPIADTSTYHCTLCCSDGKLVTTGGLSGPNLSGSDPSAQACVLDMTTNKWLSLPSMHKKRFHHGSCTLDDGRIMVVGGNGDYESIQLSSVEILKGVAVDL